MHFSIPSSAEFLLAEIWVAYLGVHFGLIQNGLMSSNLLGVILYMCRSSCNGDLWLLTYFLAALFAWAASRWGFGRVVMWVAAQWSRFSIRCGNGSKLVCTSSESVGVICRAPVAWRVAYCCTLASLFMYPFDPLACLVCRVR